MPFPFPLSGAQVLQELVKPLKQKIRPDGEHKTNSPWNIAAKFEIDMSFSSEEIAKMLGEYEQDYHTGMDIHEIANLIYDYTSGYPFLVSYLCKIIDENISGTENFPTKSDAWTKDGFLKAVRIVLTEENTLFESLDNKLLAINEQITKVAQKAAIFVCCTKIFLALITQMFLA